ncbi:MAG: hypothetical protein ACKVP4_00805 [Hyphomicrobium sp.]
MTNASISVAVLVSAGRNPVSGAARACRGDAVAMAIGKLIAGDQVRVLHAGAEEEPALRDYIALGAGRIEVVPLANNDALPSLVAALGTTDLVITGLRSEAGAGSGLLPYRLATSLGRSIVANVLEARIEDGQAHIRQFLTKGKRRGITAPLPLILAVHPLAPAKLTYAYGRRRQGRIIPLSSNLPFANATIVDPAWVVEPLPRRPILLKPAEKKAAHARMQSAIVMDAKGGVVAIEGSSVDKAQVVLSYLREHRLIDF